MSKMSMKKQMYVELFLPVFLILGIIAFFVISLISLRDRKEVDNELLKKEESSISIVCLECLKERGELTWKF